MERASKEADAAIAEFSSDQIKQEQIRRWLSEIPIGDEYGVLDADDHLIGEKFEEWCESHGIKVWVHADPPNH